MPGLERARPVAVPWSAYRISPASTGGRKGFHHACLTTGYLGTRMDGTACSHVPGKRTARGCGRRAGPQGVG